MLMRTNNFDLIGRHCGLRKLESSRIMSNRQFGFLRVPSERIRNGDYYSSSVDFPLIPYSDFGIHRKICTFSVWFYF